MKLGRRGLASYGSRESTIGSDWMITASRCSARRSSCLARSRSAFAWRVGSGRARLGARSFFFGGRRFGFRWRVAIEQRALLFGLAFDLFRLLKKIDEDRHFRAQDNRVDGLEHIIHRAHRIAAQQMLRFLIHG